MCGRYATGNTTWEQYRLWLNLTGEALTSNLEPRFNIAPTSTAPFARETDGQRTLEFGRWGIWQPWMEGKRLSTFNARAEGVETSRLYAPLLNGGRCLVPALGFYEWTGPKGQRQPHFIRHADEPLLVFAGLWASAMKDGEAVRSFTIMTCAANAQMTPVHDRMPAILNADAREAWMGGADPASVLRPWDGTLDIYPVQPLKAEDGPHQIAMKP
ncbi:MAG: SOS response-associated peptidase [Caulobacterales bacterium]|uniref:SOS response-associated peptidase n=1 Tax=Glycocaulis sp. TaxID=1969725 RepID=UPI003FA1651F